MINDLAPWNGYVLVLIVANVHPANKDHISTRPEVYQPLFLPGIVASHTIARASIHWNFVVAIVCQSDANIVLVGRGVESADDLRVVSFVQETVVARGWCDSGFDLERSQEWRARSQATQDPYGKTKMVGCCMHGIGGASLTILTRIGALLIYFQRGKVEFGLLLRNSCESEYILQN